MRDGATMTAAAAYFTCLRPVKMQAVHVKLVIVEDHLLFREVLRKLCVKEFGFKVVGEAGTGRAAVEAIRAHRPDIVLLDLNLPDGDGFDVIDQIQPENPEVRFLVLSSYCSDYALHRVEKSAAHGFVDKNTQSVHMLREALRAVSKGHSYFSPGFLEAKLERHRDPKSYIKILSDREREMLIYMGQSMSDQEIANKLGLSRKTVETHRSVILRKLGIPNTSKLIRFALEMGLAPAPPGRLGTTEVHF